MLLGPMFATIEVLYSGYRGSPVTTYKSRYNRFRPAASGWGTDTPRIGYGPTTPG
jgi:hypothetical protein